MMAVRSSLAATLQQLREWPFPASSSRGLSLLMRLAGALEMGVLGNVGCKAYLRECPPPPSPGPSLPQHSSVARDF